MLIISALIFPGKDPNSLKTLTHQKSNTLQHNLETTVQTGKAKISVEIQCSAFYQEDRNSESSRLKKIFEMAAAIDKASTSLSDLTLPFLLLGVPCFSLCFVLCVWWMHSSESENEAFEDAKNSLKPFSTTWR